MSNVADQRANEKSLAGAVAMQPETRTYTHTHCDSLLYQKVTVSSLYPNAHTHAQSLQYRHCRGKEKEKEEEKSQWELL